MSAESSGTLQRDRFLLLLGLVLCLAMPILATTLASALHLTLLTGQAAKQWQTESTQLSCPATLDRVLPTSSPNS